MLDGAQKSVRIAQRPYVLQLLGSERVDLDSDRFGHARVIHELVPSVLCARQPDVGDDLEADMLSGLLLQLLV